MKVMPSISDPAFVKNYLLSKVSPTPGCAMALRRDFEYWGLDELLIEPCCALKYYPALEVMLIQQTYIGNKQIFSKASFQVCNSQIEGDKDEQDRDEQEMKEREIFGSSSISKLRSECKHDDIKDSTMIGNIDK